MFIFKILNILKLLY